MESFHFNSAVFILLLTSTIFFSVNVVGQCLQLESSALLQLKRGFSSGELDTWQSGTDCCMWKSVTCDKWSRVIGLELSNQAIAGTINPCLFNLTSLRTLNFSKNNFDRIPIPDFGWHGLANLSSLDLSYAGFVGKVPAGISSLSKLTYLDLSSDYKHLSLTSKPTFLQNMSSLRELHLDNVNVSVYGDELYGALINSTPVLEVLSMRGCFLTGFFPKQIFQMRNLIYLDISFNLMLSGSLPDFLENGNLKILLLSFTNFSGNLPHTIGNLKFLTILDLKCCQFSSSIPPSIGNLSQLVRLDLSDNKFSGQIPFFLPFSRTYEPMRNGLTILDTHICLNGKLCNLEFLDLSNNSLSGPISKSMFTLPALRILQLHQNQFSGQLTEFFNAFSLMKFIDLSNNKLYGQIPKSLFQISRLIFLSLSSNNFSGVIEWEFIKDNQKISFLDLSNNRIQGKISSWLWNIVGLNLSCNLFTHVEEPSFNISGFNLFIDLHDNMLEGPIPSLPLNPIILLDLSNNRFTSFISYNISQQKSINYFFLANNNLMGEIPLFICNMTGLLVLDLSNNKLSGYIPSCLLDKGMHLHVLNLKGNRLYGAIPNGISSKCELQNINLRDNQLEGLLPISISNCQSLVVLDLGNNKLNDTFPFWLGNMSLLRVLILRSNKFHGLVGPPDGNHETNYTFSMLHVFDISSNNFSGKLCAPCFRNLKSMMPTRAKTIDSVAHNFPGDYYPYNGFDLNDDIALLNGFLLNLLEGDYYDIVVLTIMNKGKQMIIQKFWKIVIAIDFSNNSFEGEIPQTICELISLQVLNMSHNYLSGEIVPQLGNLSQLESLDLSMNNLSGKIPQELVYLNFLEYLNLSYNMLIGRIPIGGQFSTFPNTSFEGNKGLCWLSCNTSIPEVNNTTSLGLGGTPSKNSNYIILMGTLFGVGFGVSMAIIVVIDVMCCDRGNKRRSRRPVHGQCP